MLLFDLLQQRRVWRLALDFTAVFALWPAFLRGTLTTVLLTLSILALSTPAGLLVAIGRNARGRAVRLPLLAASWVCRGIPPLLLMLIVFFVPTQFGVNLPSFASATLAMSLYMSFYFGEIFRSGFASIDPGQYQAGHSLALPPLRLFRRIILPQMLPTVIPPYISHASSLLKNTALASAVAVRELTGIAKGLFAVTYRPIETLMVVAVIYAALSALLFGLQFAVERRFARR